MYFFAEFLPLAEARQKAKKPPQSLAVLLVGVGVEGRRSRSLESPLTFEESPARGEALARHEKVLAQSQPSARPSEDPAQLLPLPAGTAGCKLGKAEGTNPRLASQHVGTSLLCHSQGEPRGSPGFFPMLENLSYAKISS